MLVTEPRDDSEDKHVEWEGYGGPRAWVSALVDMNEGLCRSCI